MSASKPGARLPFLSARPITLAGVAVAIEKAMREGGKVLRRMDVRVEALETVERVEDGRIILA